MFNYPYGNTQELNLTWLLTAWRQFQSQVETMIAQPWADSVTYHLNDIVIYDHALYACKVATATPGEFNENEWDPISVAEDITDPAGLDSDDITNVSTAQGATVTNALNNIASQITLLNAATNNENIKFIAGCLRQDADGWFVYNADAHKSINISSVEVNVDGDLVIYYGFQGTKVCSVIATTDETFAEKYNVGTSVSGNLAKIRFWRKPYTVGGIARFASGRWDYSSSDFSNLTTASGVITLTYQEPLTNLVSQKNGFEITVQSNKYPVIMDEVTRQYIRFHMIDADGNTVTSMPSGTEFYIVKPVDGYKVDAASTEFNVPNGNIWVLGIAITTPNP